MFIVSYLKKNSLAIHKHLTTSLLGSCQVIFHSFLTIQSCKTIKYIDTRFKNSTHRFQTHWSIENMTCDMTPNGMLLDVSVSALK